jgi:hypothetical protein
VLKGLFGDRAGGIASVLRLLQRAALAEAANIHL